MPAFIGEVRSREECPTRLAALTDQVILFIAFLPVNIISNMIAYVAYIAGIAPNAVGFGGAVGAAEVPLAATRIYQLNFFVVREYLCA